MRPSRWRLGIVATSTALSLAAHARAENAPHVLVDRAVVRFHAPETGGTAEPRFITERTLAFEARLEAMAANPQGIGEGYQEHEVRAAIEHHVAEAVLASLADKQIADSPAAKRPTGDELNRVEQDFSVAMLERLGGQARVDEAARAEGIDAPEIDAILHRGAMAVWYIDRAMTPILHPSEEQLRDVYRTSAHPYHGRPLEQIRAPLERWFVVERARAAEGAFLQGARSRVKIIVTK